MTTSLKYFEWLLSDSRYIFFLYYWSRAMAVLCGRLIFILLCVRICVTHFHFKGCSLCSVTFKQLTNLFPCQPLCLISSHFIPTLFKGTWTAWKAKGYFNGVWGWSLPVFAYSNSGMWPSGEESWLKGAITAMPGRYPRNEGEKVPFQSRSEIFIFWVCEFVAVVGCSIQTKIRENDSLQ